MIRCMHEAGGSVRQAEVCLAVTLLLWCSLSELAVSSLGGKFNFLVFVGWSGLPSGVYLCIHGLGAVISHLYAATMEKKGDGGRTPLLPSLGLC